MSNKKQKYETPFEASAEQIGESAAYNARGAQDFAQKSVDQTQAAFDKAAEMAHGNVQLFDAAASAYKARFADLQMKAMEITQTNLNSGFAFARKLLAVKEPTEFFRLQQDFAREQTQALTQQATAIGELSMQLGKETVKPVQEGFMKSFGDVSKSFAA